MRRPQRLTLTTNGPYDEAVNKRPRKPAPRRATGDSLVRSLLEAAGAAGAGARTARGPPSPAQPGGGRPPIETKKPLPPPPPAPRQTFAPSHITPPWAPAAT